MNLRTLAFIWIVIGLLFAGSARADHEDIVPFSALHTQFLAFVNRLPLIRIGITNGAQLGNQAAGLIVYRRLRELGYQGDIEIVYDDHLFEKLNKIMPSLFYGRMGDYNFEYRRVRIVNFSEFQKKISSFETASVAILGARDRGKGGFGVPDGSFGPDALKADLLLQLQPAGWNLGQRSISDGLNTVSLERFSHLGLPRSIVDPYPLDMDYIYEAMSPVVGNPALRDGLSHFIHLFGHTDIGAVYGHGVDVGRPLIQYLAGIRGAFLYNSQLFPNGVVIPVFNNIILKELERMFESHADTLGTVRIMDISDPGLRRAGETLRPGEMLVVSVGTVPQRIFELMYYKSTVPPLVKGLNSIDLMKSIGRPYLPTDSVETYNFPLTSYLWPSPRARLLTEAARRAMLFPIENAAYVSKPELEKIQKTLGAFIYQAMNPTSGLNSMFEHYHVGHEDLQKDVLVRGLLAVDAYLKKTSKTATKAPWSWCTQFLKPVFRRVISAPGE